MTTRPAPQRSNWAIGVLFGVASAVLVSMGGAIVAAPVTIPLLVIVARRRLGAVRVTAIVLAALTAAEVGWAIAYVLGGETKPWIWMAPVLAAALVPAVSIRWPRWSTWQRP